MLPPLIYIYPLTRKLKGMFKWKDVVTYVLVFAIFFYLYTEFTPGDQGQYRQENSVVNTWQANRDPNLWKVYQDEGDQGKQEDLLKPAEDRSWDGLGNEEDNKDDIHWNGDKEANHQKQATKKKRKKKKHHTNTQYIDQTVDTVSSPALEEWKKAYTSKGKNTPLLTMFTLLKEHTELKVVQSIVFKNWKALGNTIQPVLFCPNGKSEVAEMAKAHHWQVVQMTDWQDQGTSYIKKMFLVAYQLFDSFFYGYSNGDLLFSSDFYTTLLNMKDTFLKPSPSHFTLPLFVGSRGVVTVNTTLLELATTANRTLLNSSHVDPVLAKKHYDFVQSLWNPKSVSGMGRPYAKQPYPNSHADYFITIKDGFPWSSVVDYDLEYDYYQNYLLTLAVYFNITVVNTSKTNGVMHVQTATSEYLQHSGGLTKLKGDKGNIPWDKGGMKKYVCDTWWNRYSMAVFNPSCKRRNMSKDLRHLPSLFPPPPPPPKTTPAPKEVNLKVQDHQVKAVVFRS